MSYDSDYDEIDDEEEGIANKYIKDEQQTPNQNTNQSKTQYF